MIVKQLTPSFKEKEKIKPEKLIKIIEEVQINLNKRLQKLKEIT